MAGAGILPFEMTPNGFLGYWNSRSGPVRVSLVLVGLVVVVALVMLGSFISRPSMEVLFRGMGPLEAKEVSQKLDELGLPYEIAENGSAILVPREHRDSLRLQLSPDLYTQGRGFSLFESNGIMLSEFERRAQWQIALQEELRRTITSIDAVEQARVHLVLPEQGVFLRDRSDASASVFLRLRPLVTLTEKQVRGILYLVAGSVENLKPENIAVVDSHGNVLYDAYTALENLHGNAEMSEQLKLKRQFERELESRIKALLERVYGPGKAVAMVSAEIDHTMKETTSVTYDNPVPRSEQRVQENYEGEGQPPGGEVGESNVPGYVSPDHTGRYSSERIQETVNYEVGEVRTYLSEAPGKIMRLSAAVIIDKNEQTEGLADQIFALVATAIGQDPVRGDTVSVQLLPFEKIEMEDWEELFRSERWREIIRYGMYAGVALLVFILLLAIIMKKPWTGMGRIEFPDRAAMGEILFESEKIEQVKRDKVRKLAEEEPENLAYLLKPWLTEK